MDQESHGGIRSELATASEPIAVIDVGATSIRMAIGEVRDSGDVRILTELSQAVSLGKDTFTKGYIERETIEESVRVLKSYCRVLHEYQIGLSGRIHVVATSAVREASNRLAFIDRVFIATGLDIEPIEEAEVNRITYLGVEPFLRKGTELFSAHSLVTEVGGGSMEILLIHEGNVVYSNAFRLGSLRLRQTLQAYRGPRIRQRTVLEGHIARTIDEIQPQVPEDVPVEVIAIGGDIRFAARTLRDDLSSAELTKISVSRLETLTNQILKMSDDEIVQEFNLTFPEAETLGPALLAYARLARTLGLKHLFVSQANLRDGLLKEYSATGSWTDEFGHQVIRSAVELGRKYHFDEQHARHVANLSETLFHSLQQEHLLDDRYGMILKAAALLHEIGLFISARSYHKHSMYLISNSELFGLGPRELRLVAVIARYHRRATPKQSHVNYMALQRDERIAVSKLASILRVAKALDESHSQRIQRIRCVSKIGQLVISIPNVSDLSLEQLALRQSGSFFEEVFGLRVLLRSVRN